MKLRFKGRFWMARLCFLAVCAYLAASTASLCIGHQISGSIKPDVSKRAGAESIAPMVLKREFQAAADRNIFRAKRERVNLLEDEVSLEAGNWEEAVPTSLQVRLISTFVFTDPVFSNATIESNNRPGVYSINECPENQQTIDPLYEEILGPSVSQTLIPCNRLMQTAIVRRIEEKRVIIYNEKENRFEYILLQEGVVPPPPRRHVSAVPVSPGSGLASTLKKIGENQFEIDAKDFDNTLGNLAQIASQARIVPAYEDGKPIGFKVFNILPGSVYDKFGLQNGDIITKINGYEINSPDKALEIYQMRSTFKQFNIDYKRAGISKTADIHVRGRL